MGEGGCLEQKSNEVLRPVNGQRICAYAKVPFGWFTMSFNGCVILAIYNALLLAGWDADVMAIRSYLHGFWRARLFGVRTTEVTRYLRKRKIPYRKVSTADELTAAMKPGDIALVMCWNRTVPYCHFTMGSEPVSLDRFPDPFGGAHGMAVTLTDQGKWKVYNRYSNRDRVYEYGSFKEFCPFEPLFKMGLIIPPPGGNEDPKK